MMMMRLTMMTTPSFMADLLTKGCLVIFKEPPLFLRTKLKKIITLITVFDSNYLLFLSKLSLLRCDSPESAYFLDFHFSVCLLYLHIIKQAL